MTRATYVLRDGKLVEKHKAAPLRTVSIIRDEMAPTRHMADGKRYTSKARFRDATRAAGCIEVGNEKLEVRTVEMSREDRVRDIKRTWEQIEQGYRPPPLPNMNWE